MLLIKLVKTKGLDVKAKDNYSKTLLKGQEWVLMLGIGCILPSSEVERDSWLRWHQIP